MKTWTKLGGKIAAALAVLGVIVFVIGMTVLGWDFKRLDVATYTAKSYVAQGASVERVDISLRTFPIEIKKGDEFLLDYFEASDSTVDVIEHDGEIKIVENYTYNPFASGLFSVGRGEHKFVMTVPQDIVLYVRGTNCKLYSEDLALRELAVNTTNADIRLSRVDIAAEFVLGATNVNAELFYVTAEVFEFTATNFNLEMTDCASGKMHIVGTNADMDIARSAFDEFAVDMTNLDLSSENDSLAACVLEATNADISLERLSTEHLTVTGVNLEADIEILGIPDEYSVFSSGRGLPDPRVGTTDKSITLKGTNNSVKLFYCS